MEICDNVPWKLDHYRAAKRQWEGEEGYLGISDHCRKETDGGYRLQPALDHEQTNQEY